MIYKNFHCLILTVLPIPGGKDPFTVYTTEVFASVDAVIDI